VWLGGLGVFGGGREGPVGFLWEWENGGVWSLKIVILPENPTSVFCITLVCVTELSRHILHYIILCCLFNIPYQSILYDSMPYKTIP
jgi:hypothetical protein